MTREGGGGRGAEFFLTKAERFSPPPPPGENKKKTKDVASTPGLRDTGATNAEPAAPRSAGGVRVFGVFRPSVRPSIDPREFATTRLADAGKARNPESRTRRIRTHFFYFDGGSVVITPCPTSSS